MSEKKTNETTRSLARLILRSAKRHDVAIFIRVERRNLARGIWSCRREGDALDPMSILTHGDVRRIFIHRLGNRLCEWIRNQVEDLMASNPCLMTDLLLEWESGVDYVWVAEYLLSEWERDRTAFGLISNVSPPSPRV